MDLESFVKCPSVRVCSLGRIVEGSVQLLEPAVMVEIDPYGFFLPGSLMRLYSHTNASI